MNNHEKINLVCFSILSFVDKLLQKTASLDALQALNVNLDELCSGSFLSVAVESIGLQLTLEIEQLFDHAHFKQFDNCSFQLLKELCLDDSNSCFFENGKAEEFAQQIEMLCSRYEKTVPLEIRNKQMAHHDVARINECRVSNISFDDERNLVEESAKLISEICTAVLGSGLMEIGVPDLAEYIQFYKTDITNTINLLPNTES